MAKLNEKVIRRYIDLFKKLNQRVIQTYKHTRYMHLVHKKHFIQTVSIEEQLNNARIIFIDLSVF
jgi:hypothetical protein